MELEFDKEIDALLRKARSPASAGAPVTSAHLEADELAAFAENALPDRTRQFYIAHLADCDACRKTLSIFISTNPEAAPDAALAAAAAPFPSGTFPWYRRLFAMPNLAYTMGGLVVLFSGIVGLLVFQNKMADRPEQTSQVTDSRPNGQEPSSDRGEALADTNSSANTMSNTSASSPIEGVTRSGVAVGSSNSMPSTSTEEKTVPSGGVTVTNEAPVTVAAAPPKPELKDADKVLAERDIKLEKENEDKKKQDAASTVDETSRRVDDQRTLKEMTPSAKSAQLRAAGPRQSNQSQINQNQVNNLPQMDGMTLSNLRTAGGKKFEFRDGVWYDTAYTGQGKKDVKRGTEKFLRLDAGLRGIADQIAGTVVVVWNGQAYRIK